MRTNIRDTSKGRNGKAPITSTVTYESFKSPLRPAAGRPFQKADANDPINQGALPMGKNSIPYDNHMKAPKVSGRAGAGTDDSPIMGKPPKAAPKAGTQAMKRGLVSSGKGYGGAAGAKVAEFGIGKKDTAINKYPSQMGTGKGRAK